MQEDPPTFIPMIEETQEAPIQTQASRREQGLEGFRVFAQDIDDWNSAEEEIFKLSHTQFWDLLDSQRRIY